MSSEMQTLSVDSSFQEIVVRAIPAKKRHTQAQTPKGRRKDDGQRAKRRAKASRRR